MSEGVVGFRHRVHVNEEMVEHGFQKLLEAGDAVAQAATLERRGGACPYCGKEFARFIIDNAYGSFQHFEPACHCFSRCTRVYMACGAWIAGCNRWLITEQLAGIDFCTSCGDHRRQAKARRTASGYRTARKASGKDAAAGNGDNE